jgi:hypothetical protein
VTAEDFGRAARRAHRHTASLHPYAITISAAPDFRQLGIKCGIVEAMYVVEIGGPAVSTPSAARTPRNCRNGKAQAFFLSAAGTTASSLAISTSGGDRCCAIRMRRRRADIDDVGARLRQSLGMKNRRAGCQILFRRRKMSRW